MDVPLKCASLLLLRNNNSTTGTEDDGTYNSIYIEPNSNRAESQSPSSTNYLNMSGTMATTTAAAVTSFEIEPETSLNSISLLKRLAFIVAAISATIIGLLLTVFYVKKLFAQ